MPQLELIHSIIKVDDVSLHIVEAGRQHNDTIVFLHGWPQDWTEWKTVMKYASATHHVIAVDLPGVGGSSPIASGEKHAMAKLIHKALETLSLGTYSIVGHDIGAMTAYAYLREFEPKLRAAVLMDSALPGLEPWSTVLANPHIWHFAFHSIPELPEALVAGNQHRYFEYFFTTLMKNRSAINEVVRKHYVEVYSTPDALQAGFDWYRGFAKDAERNGKNNTELDTPVLYIRGEFEGGDMSEYMKGFRGVGIHSIKSALISGSGHYTPEENPEEVWRAIATFIAESASIKYDEPYEATLRAAK